MEYVLKTDGLKKCYGRFRALDALSMGVPKGSVYGFVGKNGAGKTTLIRVICGLQRPTSGSYALFGRQDPERDVPRHRMGAVVESPAVYPDMTAEENLRQQCRVLGVPSFDRVGELLELVGLSDAGHKRARGFSLGMRQRLGIAVALCGRPDFLVLDEPANGLDPQGIIEIRELILKLNRERGVTVLISSHILDELARVATHYGFIDRGRMVRELSAGDLMRETRRRLTVTVSDTAALARALDGLHTEYRILSEAEAEIYDKLPLPKLTRALAAEGCELLDIHETDESLESFYLDLIGGGEHA